MHFDLKNRIYVVTGASGGIGSALVNLLNKEGAELFLIDTDQTSLDELKKEQATHQNKNSVSYTHLTLPTKRIV